MRKFYYTYVLHSDRDQQLYVGFTRNLVERFEQHKKGQVPSTKHRRPLELVYYEACLDAADTQHRERYLKTWHGKRYIRSRLKSFLAGCNKT